MTLYKLKVHQNNHGNHILKIILNLFSSSIHFLTGDRGTGGVRQAISGEEGAGRFWFVSPGKTEDTGVEPH